MKGKLHNQCNANATSIYVLYAEQGRAKASSVSKH